MSLTGNALSTENCMPPLDADVVILSIGVKPDYRPAIVADKKK